MVCTWCPCHRKATWKIYESAARRCPIKSQNDDYTKSVNVCPDVKEVEDKYELRKQRSNLGGAQINALCWLRKHITVFVDVFCEVPDLKQVEPLLYTNGRFIPALTWQLRAHLHWRHLRPARSDTHGQFRNEQGLHRGAVFSLTNYGLRAQTAIKTLGLWFV